MEGFTGYHRAREKLHFSQNGAQTEPRGKPGLFIYEFPRLAPAHQDAWVQRSLPPSFWFTPVLGGPHVAAAHSPAASTKELVQRGSSGAALLDCFVLAGPVVPASRERAPGTGAPTPEQVPGDPHGHLRLLLRVLPSPLHLRGSHASGALAPRPDFPTGNALPGSCLPRDSGGSCAVNALLQLSGAEPISGLTHTASCSVARDDLA